MASPLSGLREELSRRRTSGLSDQLETVKALADLKGEGIDVFRNRPRGFFGRLFGRPSLEFEERPGFVSKSQLEKDKLQQEIDKNRRLFGEGATEPSRLKPTGIEGVFFDSATGKIFDSRKSPSTAEALMQIFGGSPLPTQATGSGAKQFNSPEEADSNNPPGTVVLVQARRYLTG